MIGKRGQYTHRTGPAQAVPDHVAPPSRRLSGGRPRPPRKNLELPKHLQQIRLSNGWAGRPRYTKSQQTELPLRTDKLIGSQACLHDLRNQTSNPRNDRMKRAFAILFAFCSAACLFAQMGNMTAPTFTRDVAPNLQKNCQNCHRPGEAGPFSMLTYEDTRPWAGAIKLAVQQKIMPPWFADPQHGHFANDRSLSQKDIHTIVAWVTAGAPKGDPKDMPAP